MEETDIVPCLAALAQPVRLRTVRALITAGAGGLTPGALGEALGVLPATLSFHLKELARAGLVTQERDGRHLIYRASVGPIDGLIAYLTAHCCPGAPSLDGCVAEAPGAAPGPADSVPRSD